MAELIQKEPALMFFYEVMNGDIKKYAKKSNKEPSGGGGARDLRPRPASGFVPILRAMFPRETKKTDVYEGTIHWYDDDGHAQSEKICLWAQYKARGADKEARIATAYKVGAWTVSEANYAEALQRGKKWFYVLIMDKDNVVWAYTMREEDLDQWTQQVRHYVQKRIELTPRSKRPPHVVGSLNFVTDKEYP